MARNAVEPVNAGGIADVHIPSPTAEGPTPKLWQPDPPPLHFVSYSGVFPTDELAERHSTPPPGVESGQSAPVANRFATAVYTGGLVAVATAALDWYQGRVWRPYQAGSDVLRSMNVTQAQIDEVGGEYIQFLIDHKIELGLTLAAFMAADLTSGLLAKSKKPTHLAAAGVIQLLVSGVSAYGVKVSVDATLTHAEEWLRDAWTASLDPATREQQVEAASKAYLRMWVSFLMACLAAGATLRTVANAFKFLRFPARISAPVRAALDDPAVLRTARSENGSFHVPNEAPQAAPSPSAAFTTAEDLQFNAAGAYYEPVSAVPPSVAAPTPLAVLRAVPLRTLRPAPLATAANPWGLRFLAYPAVASGILGTTAFAANPVDQAWEFDAHRRPSPVIRSGGDIVAYDPTTHAIRFRGGGTMDARYVTARIDDLDYRVLSINTERRTGDFESMASAGPEVLLDHSLDDQVIVIAPIAGGAPNSKTRETTSSTDGSKDLRLAWRRGLPPHKLSRRRKDHMRALRARIGVPQQHEPFGFSDLATFAHPHVVANAVKFLGDPRRVADQLMRFQNEVNFRYKLAHRDSHALGLEVLADLEKRNGFVPSANSPLPFRLIFHGALSLEMAHNPQPFAVSGGEPLLPSIIVDELQSQWNHALNPNAPYRALRHFPEFMRGPADPVPGLRSNKTRPTQRISAWKPLYNKGGVNALAQMSAPVQEVFDLIVQKHQNHGAAQNVVEIDSIQNLLMQWRNRVGQGYVPSATEAIAEIRLVLQRADAGTIVQVGHGGALGYRYHVASPYDKSWCSIHIHGHRYLIYLKMEHFKVLQELVEVGSLTSFKMEEVFRSEWMKRHPKQKPPTLDARSIKGGINHALEHAVRIFDDSAGEVQAATVADFDRVTKGRQQVYVYRVEPPDASKSESLSPKPQETQLVERTYDIDGDQTSVRLRPRPHKIFARLLQQYSKDREGGRGALRGFTTDAELIGVLRREMPQQSSDDLQAELNKIISNQLRSVLRGAGIGTIKQVVVDSQQGHLFARSLRVDPHVSKPMEVQGRKIWLELRDRDRPLVKSILNGRVDSVAIQRYFQSDWASLYSDRPVSDSRVVKNFVDRANNALGRGRMSEDGPPTRVGIIVRTDEKDGKAYFYEFRSLLGDGNGKDGLLPFGPTHPDNAIRNHSTRSSKPLDASKAELSASKPHVPQLVKRTYDIDGHPESLQLQALPHKVFVHLLKQYGDDREVGRGAVRGFTADTQLIEVLGRELPQHSNDELWIALRKIIENQLKPALNGDGFGRIAPAVVNGQHGYLFTRSPRADKHVTTPMDIEGRRTLLELQPRDRSLVESIVRNRMDSTSIRQYFQSDRAGFDSEGPVLHSSVVTNFISRANRALGSARFSEDGSPTRVGIIVPTEVHGGKTRFYEFRSLLGDGNRIDALLDPRLARTDDRAGDGDMTRVEAHRLLEAKIDKAYANATKGSVEALYDLLAYIVRPPTRVYGTPLDPRAAARVWQLVRHGSGEVQERALQGLELVLTSSTANSSTQANIVRRVVEMPVRCIGLVMIGLDHSSPEVQRAAIWTTRKLAEERNALFVQLWRNTARSLWDLSALWETKSPKGYAELKKVLMDPESNPTAQTFIMKLVAERQEGSYGLVESALGHPDAAIRRMAAHITLDWVVAEVPRFRELWEKKGPDDLKEWFALELEKRVKERKKKSRRPGDGHDP
jgi:hypothetical protein